MASKLSVDEANHGKSKPASKPTKVAEDYNAPFRGFVNVDITDGLKAQYDHWLEGQDFDELLSIHATDGVVVSLKINTSGGGFMASATQRRVSSPNAGLAVTVRSKTPSVALWRLLFVLALLPATDWTAYAGVVDGDRW